jgi:hypothetical protein
MHFFEHNLTLHSVFKNSRVGREFIYKIMNSDENNVGESLSITQ